MPLAKPIRTSQRKHLAAHARDRVIKLKVDIFQSTAILCEFLYYAFNAILGLRQVYPEQDFKWDRRYDIYLPMLLDSDLKGYLTRVTTQLKPWLETKKVNRIVLAIVSKETRETLERWQFDIHSTTEEPSDLVNPSNPSAGSQMVPLGQLARSDHEMQAEALQIFRQIFSSITFMPALESDECLFTILSYVDKSEKVPVGWTQSNPHIISANAVQVPIRSLTTSIHRLVPTVTYRPDSTPPEEEEKES